MFRLLGHQGSVLALMVVKEKGWLVSSSSESLNTFDVFCSHCHSGAGDVRVSSIISRIARWLTDISDLVDPLAQAHLHHPPVRRYFWQHLLPGVGPEGGRNPLLWYVPITYRR